ncbi:MAG TPA: hypothetical protein VJU77_09950 [Chthoniobacterales bacterium]|nr:hypothetical protein [Chthoniobacterales bacterium]
MKISPKDREVARAYEAAKPKQFGNLHQRMKFVMRGLEEARGWNTSEPDPQFDEDHPDLVHGLFDLEKEIKYHVPAKPPFATRIEPRPIRKPRSN